MKNCDPLVLGPALAIDKIPYVQKIQMLKDSFPPLTQRPNCYSIKLTHKNIMANLWLHTEFFADVV